MSLTRDVSSLAAKTRMRENLLRGGVRVGAGGVGVGVGQNADGGGGSRGLKGGTGFGAMTRQFRRMKTRNCGSDHSTF